jgi:hypothetical protein
VVKSQSSAKRVLGWSVGVLVVLIGGVMFMTQRQEDVLVRDPGNRMYNVPVPVAQRAEEEREYAVLSENVYIDTWTTRVIGSRGPGAAGAEAYRSACGDPGHSQPLPLAGWTRWEQFPSADLIEEADKADLYFEVWESEASPLRVVVVFRGTDSLKDWRSNLRWILRFVPWWEDQYHFVSRRVGEEFSRRILSNQAKYQGATVLATGHSLGGGLAQHFAYSLEPSPRVPRVSRVFAFDPSPVTGWSSVKSDVRQANAKGLKTDRIFEHGEILAYVRLLLSYVNPPPAIDPSVSEVRYNFVPSINPLTSHSMRQLACDLVRASSRDPSEERPIVRRVG